MDLHQYLQALRKFWWVILIPTVFAGISGAYQASNVVPKFQASVTFFVTTAGDDTTSAAVQGDQFAQRRVNSYVALLRTDRLAEMVLETSGLDLPAGQIRGMIGGSGDVDTVLLTATATSTSRALAMAVADAVAVDFVRLVDEVETSGVDSASVDLEVVSGPSVKQLPVRTRLTVALRAAFGAFLGLVAALLLELRDTTVRSEDQVTGLASSPVLGRIPFDRRVRAAPLLVEVDNQSPLAESFRQLRTNLQFLDVTRLAQVVVVTSSVADEGKSITASNLAMSLVANNSRVLLIEADLRRPTVSDHFDIDRSHGLTDVLAGQVELDDVLHQWTANGLYILPSGPLPPNPSELLGSSAMRRLIERLRSQFDVVILDTPPLLPVSDGAVAAAWADGVILVVRSGKTTRHELSQAVRSLEAVNARVLGAVMTMTATGRRGGYEPYGRRSEEKAAPWQAVVAAVRRVLSAEAAYGRPHGSGQHDDAGTPTPAGRPPDQDRAFDRGTQTPTGPPASDPASSYRSHRSPAAATRMHATSSRAAGRRPRARSGRTETASGSCPPLHLLWSRHPP